MRSNPTVVVVGAGVAGLSAAWRCAEMGASSVTVLDQYHLAQASSGLSAGIFNRQTVDRTDLQMRIASVSTLTTLAERGLLSLNRCGYLRLVRTQGQWDEVIAAGGRLGATTRLLGPGQIAELVPGIRTDDVVGAMYGAQDGHVDGPSLCQAYLEAGRVHGVRYRARTPVQESRKSGGRHVLQTPAGPVEADVVINASGAWLSHVGDLLGAPVRLVNQRHQTGIVRVPSLHSTPVPTVQTYFPGSGASAVYVRPDGPGRFVTGLHSYEVHGQSEDPDSYGRKVEPEYLELLAECLLDRFPGWDDASLEAGWTGLYPISADGRFIIGPHRADPSVITLGGLGGVGLTVSPAAGLLAAEWALRGEVSSLEPDVVDSFLPDRSMHSTREC